MTTRDKIVNCALELAEQCSWEAVRLHQIAAELKIPLSGIRAHFREKQEIADAWFDRADAALLLETARADFPAASPRARLTRTLMGWFAALAPHRRVTRQMIYQSLEFGHLHYQVRGLSRISRTVQWWREAAGRTATGPRRAFEETALTSVYLASFSCWMRDDSAEFTRTRAFLDSALARADCFMPPQ